ncbi:MAG: hypothetical protein V7603_5078 [Micromonosporaceae bacterium]
MRRIRLGATTATAAAREYLSATRGEVDIAALMSLVRDWGTQAARQRQILLGDATADYERRTRELMQAGADTTAAQAQAFTELAPDPATQERALAEHRDGGVATVDAAAAAPDPQPPAPPRFRPSSQDELAPSGEVARINANIAALRTLRTVLAAARPATADEQAILARWSGWGAVPAALDPMKEKYTWVREALAGLLNDKALAAARRTVINAHYTDLALTQAIWDGVAQLGFDGGQVLEPGCGAGNFIAAAPDTARITGVELDPTTAAIATVLHPHAQILTESFAATRVPTASVDLTIGNVPFGDVRLYDKRDNRGNHAIHNHFIIKALRATRPGGLVAVITSAYTMDATNPAARREMQQMGDLVAAVRLPSRAHRRAAGTDALTDLLVLRRREDDREPAPFDWEYTAPVDIDGTTVRLNSFFVEHPHRILGTLAVGDGLYRHDEVSVAGDPVAAPTQLREALTQIADEARQAGLLMTPGSGEATAAQPAALLPSAVSRPDGYLRANADGTFSRLDDGQWEPYAPPKAQAGELRALLRLRDIAVALLEAEAASLDDTDQIDELRARLNSRYDAYVAEFDPINRFTEEPRKRLDKNLHKMVPAFDEETGEPLLKRVRPPQGQFRTDPFSPVVRALEVFDEESKTATKADIFTQRVVAPRPARLGADTPDDALAICLDELGEARLATVAWLLGVDEPTARQALGTLVYDDPDTSRMEPAAAYLSGDVKTKLAIAKAAADEDPRYEVNVAALTEVVPRDLGPEEITDSGAVKMGAPWIGAGYVQQFLTEILDDPTVKVEYGGGGMWSVGSERDDTVAARSAWGTDRRAASEVAQHILEQREFVIKDTVGSGANKRQVINLDAIMAATEKAVEMREKFADWVWEDPDRVARLVAKYNDVFQRYVPRSYSDVQLSLPGLAQVFRPDPHQVAAAARIIHEPAVGLYHCVGAGKTASMIMGAMELRRLGLARKPVVVVPNQLLDQWTREFMRLYPQAKVLSASTDDLKGERRQLMVARMATGDWDAVILTEDAFEMLPMTDAAEQAYVDQQLADLEERIGEARANGAELTLKRLQTKLANREARLEDRLDREQDAGIWWELTGIDYIFRDESHRDKNLRTVSNVPGMSIKGSKRATQMDMKLAWLRERQPRWGTRATGTPIANSIVELYTEYRYLRPDLMEQQGITDIDSWLATYAQGKVIIEVTPDGGGLRNKTRFDFVNLDKLVTTLHVFADVKTKDDLPLERPPLAARADGQRLPEMVVVQPSTELLAKVAELVERAARLKGKRPEKGADNILKIVGEGAAAALDLRLVGLTTDEIQKLDVAADRIAGYYHANKDHIYLGADGEPHRTPGSLQQVFCDLGTPNKKDPKRWTAYAALRQKLVDRDVPRDKIRFIHEADDDRARAELFASCRDGRTAVLISSTEKGGTGVNAQDRMLVLHHLDTPYRPCDLEQREGRIDRRGNQNDEIHIERYVTERSLDAFKWQKVAYKATLADRVLTGRAGARAEDVGDVTLSYEEIKAASTGQPLLVDHAKAKADLARLERLERGHHRNRGQLDWTIRNSRQEIAIDRQVIAEADAAITRRVDTRGDKFAMTVRGAAYRKRGEANDRLKTVLGLILADPRNMNGPTLEVGQISGFTLTAKVEKAIVNRWLHETVLLRLADVPGGELRLVNDDLEKGDIVSRLENRLAKVESVRDGAAADIQRRESEIARAEQELTKPFRHADDLAEARTRFQQLDIQVIALAAASEEEAAAAERGDAEDGEQREPAPDEARAAAGGPGHATGPGAGPTGHAGAASGQQRRDPAPVRVGGAAEDGATMEQVLAEASLTAQQRDWLTTQIGRLTTNPRVAMTARAARDYDDFHPVFDPALEESLLSAADDVDSVGEALAIWYFSADPQSREAFSRAAGHAVYEQIRAMPAPAPTEPVRVEVNGDIVRAHGVAVTDQQARLSLAAGNFTATADPTVWQLPDIQPLQVKREDIIRFAALMRRAGRPVPVTGPTTAEPDDAAAPLTLDPWLANQADSIRRDMTAEDKQWLEQQIRDTATNPEVHAAAWSHPEDDFHTVVAAALADRFADRAEQNRSEFLLACTTPNWLPSVHRDLLRHASRHLYRRIRATEPAPDELTPGPDTVPYTPVAAGDLAPGDRIVAGYNLDASPKVAAVAEISTGGGRVYIDLAGQEQRETYYPGDEVRRVSTRRNADLWVEPPPHDPTGDDDRSAALPETQRVRRGHPFYPPAAVVATVPRLYATEHQADGEKVLHLHYFAGGSDWWVAEYDPATGDAYGYACLGDPDNAEWGNFNLVDLERVTAGVLVIERDRHWTPVPAGESRLPGHRAPSPSRAPQPGEDETAAEPDAAPAPVVPARGGLAPTAGDEPVTIEVNGDSVLVRGSDKADSQMRDALAEAGFKWYRSLQCWGLPRNWHHDTRMQRVAQLLRRLREHGRILPVEDPIDRRLDDLPATGPLTLQPVERNDLRVGDQVQMRTTGADAYPWHGLGFPNDDRVLVEGVYVGTTGLDGRGELLDLVVTGPDGRRNEIGRRILLLPESVPVLRAEPTPAPKPAPEDERVAALRTHLSELAEQAERDAEPLVRADELRRLAAWPTIRLSEDARFFAIAHRPPMDASLPARWEAREATIGFPLTLATTRVDEDAVDGLLAALSASGVDFAFQAQHKFPEASRVEINRVLVEAHEAARTPSPPPPAPSAAPTGTSDVDGVEAEPEPDDGAADTSPAPELDNTPPAATVAAPPGPEATPQAATVVAPPEPDAPADPEPDSAPPSWAQRIQIVERGRDLVVTGTTGHPREDGLRGLLKQHRFRYSGAQGEWRYAGRSQDRPAAVGDIQRWLAAKDRAETARKPGPQLPPTAQQQHIIDAYRTGQTITVQALAGTGKTSTLLMLAADQPSQRIAYIAFNRSIADEAQRKFPRNVNANTAHGFARAGLAGTTLAAKVDKAGPKSPGARWPEDWARALDISPVDTGDQLVEPETIARLVMGTIRTFRESADDAIGATHLPKGTLPALAEPVLTYAAQAWRDITDPAGQLMFDHDDYLKIWALHQPRLTYDVIFFDEAQDINPVLRKVIQDQPVQTVVVGDSNQSIYGFRGAIDALRGWPADVELPLTQSWRFGPAGAEVGNRFLGLLRSPFLLTGNPAMDTTIGPVEQPDAVLARTNAGAVAAVFDAFDAGRRVALVGGGQAIEEIAKAAKDLQRDRRTKHPELSRFANWGEVRAYVEEDEHAQSLRAFVRLVDRRGADGLLHMVRELVDEEDVDTTGKPNYDVIVSTVHKAKGREWNQVRVAEDFPQPQEDLDSKRVVLPDPEELRLAYVTVTRARQRLDPGSLAWINDYAPRAGAPAPAAELAHHRDSVADLPPDTATTGQTTTAGAASAAPAVVVEEPRVGGDVPAHSPYQAGDRVQMHGFATATSDLGRRGFVGVVRGFLGSTILTGTTDDGWAWSERWGALVPAGAPNRSAATNAGAAPRAQERPDVDGPFTPVELATIRNAVADHAARFYGGPAGFGRDSAARYVSEGQPLSELRDRHGRNAVWEAVAVQIRADESVLTRSEEQRAAGQRERQARIEALMARADTAFEQRDFDLTVRLLDEAQLVDPAHRPTLGGTYPYTWAELRKLVTDASTEPAPTPDATQPEPDPQQQPAPDTAMLDQATVVPVLLAHPAEIDPHDCLTAEPTAEVTSLVDGGAFSHPADRDPAQYAEAAADVVKRWHGLAAAELGPPWVQVLSSEQVSGHKLHVAAANLEQVREALSRVWVVCQQAGLGLKAAGGEENLAYNNGKGLTIYLPRRDTIHRDASLVAAALDGYHPGVDIYGDTRLSDAVWHRYEFTHDPGHDVDLFRYRQLYRPADRPQPSAAEPAPAAALDRAPGSPAVADDRAGREATSDHAGREGVAPGPAVALDAWLQSQPARLREGLPATARRWLSEQIAAIATEPAVIRAALAAGSAADLAAVDRRLAAEISRSEGWRLPEARKGQFFTDYLDRPAVQDALHTFARQVVYDALRGAAPPVGPVADGTRSATAAQLARLDTAPGVSAGPATSPGDRDAYSSSVSVAGRRAGPGV